MAEKREELIPSNITRNEAIAEFEKIRMKQRKLYAEMIDTELELKDYEIVAKILRKSNPKRKCYRLMSDILVESDVKNILPLFFTDKNEIETRIEELQPKMRQCADELEEFQKTYNIQIKKDEKGIPDFPE